MKPHIVCKIRNFTARADSDIRHFRIYVIKAYLRKIILSSWFILQAIVFSVMVGELFESVHSLELICGSMYLHK